MYGFKSCNTGTVASTSKAIKAGSERRAKKLHFYQNGKPYDPKLTVSMIPGKEFYGLEQLYQFLTEKTKILNGVQYIFTTYGETIRSLDQLEHDQVYIVSGSKSFIHYPYGTAKNGPITHQTPITTNTSSSTTATTGTSPRRHKILKEDDLRLIRPLSSKYNNVYSNVNHSGSNLPIQTRDVRSITVVNNKNHDIYSKVILNLKSPKSFDLLLSDLGDAVQMRSPIIMFTHNGQKVKSVSHLKHDLAHINLFYIDNEHPEEPFFDDPFGNDNDSFYYTQSMAESGFRPSPKDSNSNSTPNLHTAGKLEPSKKEPFHSPVLDKKRLPLLEQAKPTFVDKQKREPETTIIRTTPTPTITTFNLEQLSPYKYEQIQLYAERLLNDTSFQIKSEFGLIVPENVTTTAKNGLNPTKKAISNPDITITSPITKRKSRAISNRTYDIPKKIAPKSTAKNIGPLPTTVKSSTLKKTTPSISLSNDRINEMSKPKKFRFLSNENLNNMSSTSVGIKSVSGPSRVSGKNPTPKMAPSPSRHRSRLEVNPIVDKKPSLASSRINERSVKAKNLKEPSKPTKSNQPSQKHVDKDSPMAKVKLREIEKYLHGKHNPPPYYLCLEKVFGYNGRKSRDLVYLNTGELAFYSGVFAILWNPNTGKQRFYAEHENDICCLRVDPNSEHIATIHPTKTTMVIRIWSIKTLKTIRILANKMEFVDMEFTMNNFLFVLTGGKESNLSLWNWRFKMNITNTSKMLDHNEQVFGLTVHPQESDIVVTYGKMHLVVWHFRKDKSVECRTALQMQSTIVKTIHCAEFLNDNSLLTGDSVGNLTIWAPFEANKVLEFAIKEVKGHESQLTCFKLTKDNILISGDKEGAIKTWDVNDNEFRLLNAVKLTSLSGSVSAITIPNKLNDAMNIFVGTSNSFILRGSALQPDDYQIVFEGHYMAIRTVTVDHKNNFYTASLDRKICKWNQYGLIWKTDSNIQGMSSSIHPSGQVLAVGSANGIVVILDAITGEALQYIQLTNVCIGCMSYSPNGNFLVAGCQDGSLHVIPVTDNGRSYDKVSILKGPLPILTLQWSLDTQFILTSVDDDNYQELILWDLPNSRYIRNVTSFSDNLQWYNVTCSGLEDARGTWDNDGLKDVINMCKNYSPSLKCIVTGDENGFIRLFAYPCFETKSAYFQYKQGGGSVTDVKFSHNEEFVIACNFEGSIFLWRMLEYPKDSS